MKVFVSLGVISYWNVSVMMIIEAWTMGSITTNILKPMIRGILTYNI